MKYFSQVVIGFTIICLVIWQLPWIYNFLTAKSFKTPFTLYSTVIGDFAVMESVGDKGIIHRDLSGRVYSEAQFDSILPLFYYRQLMADERFPDTLHGVMLTPRLVQQENFTFRVVPSDINSPVLRLYPLFEGMTGRVDLQMPDDVFRVTSRGIEFIQMQTNRLDAGKSKRFTDAMLKKGFVFPAVEIAGNPTIKKEYDEGYLLLDSKRQLFHLKQMKGRPYVRRISLPDGLQLEHLFVTEFKSRKTLAFMTDVHHALYVLENKTYVVKKVGIPSFNPQCESLAIIGNLFDWTLRITRSETETYYAVRADDYSLLKELTYSVPELSLAEKIGKYLFPLQLTFTSSEDEYVKPRL